MKRVTPKEGAAHILKGGVVAFPTETVYGLGASIFDEKAVAAMYAIKKRPMSKPLGAYLYDINQVYEVATALPPLFFKLAKAFLPGPLTLIVPKHPNISPLVTSGGETIAIRMPDHPVAQAFLKEVGHPVAGTSANLSNQKACTSLNEVQEQLGNSVPGIDGGECAMGVASTILSLCTPTPTFLRIGALSKEQISFFL